MTHNQLWSDRADVAQRSLDYFYGTDAPQYLNNWWPSFPGSNEVFNYWWLAHVIDARLDAFERSGEAHWLDLAHQARENLLERNRGSLFNDYFDDMLWFALSLERMARLEDKEQYLDESQQIWERVIDHGWNDVHGPSLAWREQQLYYKNTPANGPLIILSARLYGHDQDPKYLHYAQASYDWLTETLVDPITGFVEDGINREQDDRIDTQWRFTYNQGLYVGANVELSRLHDADDVEREQYLDRAQLTADTAIRKLAAGEVFRPEGDDGDEGLFKGIYYRYATLMLSERLDDLVAGFIRRSTNVLWSGNMADGHLFSGNDWHKEPTQPIPYSTLLSAIMATEARARIEAADPA